MSYKFFTNKQCEYYPCHEVDELNCLFCYCPLYHRDDCPGTPEYVGITKDCSNCAFPHKPENYEEVICLLICKAFNDIA